MRCRMSRHAGGRLMDLVGFMLGEVLVAVVWFFLCDNKGNCLCFSGFLGCVCLEGAFGRFCSMGAESFGLHTYLERLFVVGLVLGLRFLSWQLVLL